MVRRPGADTGADDTGAVAANALVIAPALLLFLLVVQGALWFYGRSVATSAAHHGLEAARLQDSTAADGEAMAENFIDQVGGLSDHEVTVTRGPDLVRVDVEGSAINILPLVNPPPPSASLTGPVERVVD